MFYLIDWRGLYIAVDSVGSAYTSWIAGRASSSVDKT